MLWCADHAEARAEVTNTEHFGACHLTQIHALAYHSCLPSMAATLCGRCTNQPIRRVHVVSKSRCAP